MRVWLFLTALLVSASALADTTITYQGQLQQGGTTYTGSVDMEFQLHRVETGHDPVGPLLSQTVAIVDGLFQVELDFGVHTYEQGRWLNITVDGQDLSPRHVRAAGSLPAAVVIGPIGTKHRTGVRFR